MQGRNDSVLTRMKGVAGSWSLCFEILLSHISPYRGACKQSIVQNYKSAHTRCLKLFQAVAKQAKELCRIPELFRLDIDKILKLCQTHWLSVAKCVERILEQWPALEIFFVAEAAEN